MGSVNTDEFGIQSQALQTVLASANNNGPGE